MAALTATQGWAASVRSSRCARPSPFPEPVFADPAQRFSEGQTLAVFRLRRGIACRTDRTSLARGSTLGTWPTGAARAWIKWAMTTAPRPRDWNRGSTHRSASPSPERIEGFTHRHFLQCPSSAVRDRQFGDSSRQSARRHLALKRLTNLQLRVGSAQAGRLLLGPQAPLRHQLTNQRRRRELRRRPD